jgi:dipeptidyl aminopeptidase/acylaminoacyl peptidase
MLADQPVATATFTTVPTPTGTAKPATKAPTIPAPPTPTPLFVLLSDKTALARYIRPTRTPYPELTAMPPGLVGKIGFRSNMLGATDRTYVVGPDGSGLAYLTVPWCYDAALALEGTAPQGGARVLQAKGRHGLDLFLLLDNGSRQQLTFVGAGKAYDAAWSPSGDRVVFASNQEGDDDIFVVVFQSLDDPRPRTAKVTDDTWESDKHPSFSPDGAQIVYYSNATGRRQLWIASATGEGVPRLLDLEGECWNPVWFK